MLLKLAMASQIGALMAGVFGFEDPPSALPAAECWARALFGPLLGIAAAAFVSGTIRLDHDPQSHQTRAAVNESEPLTRLV